MLPGQLLLRLIHQASAPEQYATLLREICLFHNTFTWNHDLLLLSLQLADRSSIISKRNFLSSSSALAFFDPPDYPGVFVTQKRGPCRKSKALSVYPVVISLYSPDTQPTWLPIFTACQPLNAEAIYSITVPGATAVIRLYLVPLPVRMLTLPPEEWMVT